MYAIIQSGGKQYKVKKGDIVDVELLNNEESSTIEFSEILMVSDGTTVKIGSPSLSSEAKVIGELVGQVKGPKVISYRYKQRKNQRRKVGHRQKYSRVKIVDIVS